MNDMIIAPASPPPQSVDPSTKSGTPGDDSSFGPHLTAAISEKESHKQLSNSSAKQADSSSTSPQENTLSEDNGNTAKDAEESELSLAENQNQASLNLSGYLRLTTLGQKSSSDGQQSAVIPTSGNLPDDLSPISGKTEPSGKSVISAETLGKSEILDRKSSNNLPQSNQSANEKLAPFQQKQEPAPTRELSSQLKMSPQATFGKENGQTGFSQKAYSQTNPAMANQWDGVEVLQARKTSINSGPVSFLSNYAQDNTNTGEQTKSIISTENILAKLTQFEDEQLPGSLRSRANETLRHNIQGQYMDAKTQNANVAVEQQSSGQKQMSQDEKQQLGNQFHNQAQQQSSTTDSVYHPVTSNQASTSGESIASMSKPLATTTSMSTMENDIIHQVLQKFNVANIQQNSKIVIKLHPAELGELKVDIQLKEGAINANIVAQSRHVHEILEKQMPKLKALMEQNGLVVDDIKVTLKSEVIGEYTLFHDDLAKDNHSSGRKKQETSSVPFSLDYEEDDIQLPLDATPEHNSQGVVNVKA